MSKMNRLMFGLFLSSGLLSSVNGSSGGGVSIGDLSRKNNADLFNEFGTLDECNASYDAVQRKLANEGSLKDVGEEGRQDFLARRSNLLDLAERLNLICIFWCWFSSKGCHLGEEDMKRILSEDVSGDDLESLGKLRFLRNVNWGEGLTDSVAKETKEGLQRLQTMYEKSI